MTKSSTKFILIYFTQLSILTVHGELTPCFFYKKIKINIRSRENLIYIISVVENRDADSPNSRKVDV